MFTASQQEASKHLFGGNSIPGSALGAAQTLLAGSQCLMTHPSIRHQAPLVGPIAAAFGLLNSVLDALSLSCVVYLNLEQHLSSTPSCPCSESAPQLTISCFINYFT